MWAYTQQLATFLLSRFTTVAEQLGQPVHLDKNVMVSPALAIDALRLELRRMADISQQHAIAAIKGAHASEIEHLHLALNTLNNGVESFVNQLERERLNEATAVELSSLLRVNNYLAEIDTLAEEIAHQAPTLQHIRDSAAGESCEHYLASVLSLLRACDLQADTIKTENLDAQYKSLRKQWHDLKSNLLQKATVGQLPLSGLNTALEMLRSALRIAEQSTKVAERLNHANSEPGATVTAAN